MEIENWREIDGFLEKLLDYCRDDLDADLISNMQEYLEHGEYEMAFEGLFLAIMENGHSPDLDLDKVLDYAIDLKLNEETMYDEDFWEKLKKFVYQ